MAGDKTAALMACACSIGAVHLGAPPTLAMALAEFGAHVGLAFQLTDDLLGIWGAPEVTGKPVRADLRARKKSLPVVAALTSGTPEAEQLRELLTDPQPLSDEDLIRAADLVVAAGGRQWAEAEADAQLAAANASLADVDLPAERPRRADRHRRVHHGSPVVAIQRSPIQCQRSRRPRSGPVHPGPRPDARARAAARRGLVEGRARDQRDDGRRGPAAAPVPRHAWRRRPDRGGGTLDPLAAARRTAPGPTSTAAPPTCPPRSRPTWRCGWPATSRDAAHMQRARDRILAHGRRRGDPGIHPASGWPCPAGGPGTTCPSCRPS